MKTFAELNFPGRLIAVEGLDGSGKSTQIYLLKRWLELQELKVYFSEWNSSELVKSATSKGKKRELLTPTTFSLIHATDFADRYERHLVPLLRAGYIVLCDRYIFTAFARDVVRGCPPEWVRGIYNFAALPDLTFFFKSDLEVSLKRILDGRPQLKYFEAGMDLRLSTDPYESFRIFQGRILEQYLAMSTEFNFLVVDANQVVEKQQAVVRELVTQRLRPGQLPPRRTARLPKRPAEPRKKAKAEETRRYEERRQEPHRRPAPHRAALLRARHPGRRSGATGRQAHRRRRRRRFGALDPDRRCWSNGWRAAATPPCRSGSSAPRSSARNWKRRRRATS